MEPLTSAWVQSDVEYSPFPDPYLSAGIFNATRGRSRPAPPPRCHPITAAVAAITAPIITATPVAITTSECATIDPTALWLSPGHSLPTPCTGRPTLAPSPPPPPSISKTRRCRSPHPRRRHRPCHHLGRNRRRCRALRRVRGPFGPPTPSVKKKCACNGHFSGPLWS